MMDWISTKQILVPIDLTDLAINGLRTAMEMIEDPVKQLTVVYVLPRLDPCEPGVLWKAIDDLTRLKNMRRSLELFLERHELPRLQMEVLIGEPGREIVLLAKRKKSELIVIPSHSRGVLSRWILGSVTDYVLHHSPCPVLFLKS